MGNQEEGPGQMSFELPNVITERGRILPGREGADGDAWYLVVGIELVLFAAMLGPIIYGALASH